MGIVARQSVITTIISYCGVIIGYINLLYLYPKFLNPEQIGLFRTIQDAAILFTPFAQFGLAQSIARYYPRLVNSRDSTGSFVSLILLMALGGFAVFLIFFKLFENSILSYFQENANAIITYSTLVLWLTLILLILAVFEAFSRSLLRTVVPSLLRELVARFLLAVFVTLYFLEYLTFNQFIVSSAITYVICLIILLVYLMAKGEIRVDVSLSKLDTTQLPGLFKYSLLSFAGTAGFIIVGKVDSIMVSAMLNLSANAIYTTAFYMATVIEIPKRALSQLAMPLISRAFEKNDLKEIGIIYQKTSINQFVVGTLLLIGVWINLDSIFALMPNGSIYDAGFYVVLIVGGGKLIDMMFGPSSEVIVMSKYYGFNIVLIMMLAVFVVVANNLLIPQYGINGAAIGSALALIGFNVIKYVFIYVKLQMQPFTTATFKVVAVAAVVVMLHFIIPRMGHPIIDMVVRSSVVTIVFGVLIYILKVTPDGNNLLDKVLILLGVKLK